MMKLKNGKIKLNKRFKIWNKYIYIYIYIYIYMHDFQQFETIRSFGDNIYTGKISVNEAEMDQVNLLEKMKK